MGGERTAAWAGVRNLARTVGGWCWWSSSWQTCPFVGAGLRGAGRRCGGPRGCAVVRAGSRAGLPESRAPRRVTWYRSERRSECLAVAFASGADPYSMARARAPVRAKCLIVRRGRSRKCSRELFANRSVREHFCSPSSFGGPGPPASVSPRRPAWPRRPRQWSTARMGASSHCPARARSRKPRASSPEPRAQAALAAPNPRPRTGTDAVRGGLRSKAKCPRSQSRAPSPEPQAPAALAAPSPEPRAPSRGSRLRARSRIGARGSRSRSFSMSRTRAMPGLSVSPGASPLCG
jgi:hypothetical protein